MTQIDIYATVVHSCQGLSVTDLRRITAYYGSRQYVTGWIPGNRLTKKTVHFSQAEPATDRNDIEKWDGEWVRIISMKTALIESKGIN